MQCEVLTSQSGQATAAVQSPAEHARRCRELRPLNLLAYVHLRNIHGSTGAGRVARQLIEQLALDRSVQLHILADQADRNAVVPLVGKPWDGFRYHTFAADTSRQQARWYALQSPRAESFWPEAEITFCTGESYVPVRRSRLVVTAHDAAYFEPQAHRRGSAFWRQRLKWTLLFRRLAARADMIHTVSQFSADRLAHFFPSLKDRLRVIPNAVTDCFFLPVTDEGNRALQRLRLKGQRFLLVPGGLHFRKNAELILRLLPKMLDHFHDLRIVIAGHCDATYRACAEECGPRVLFPGFVDDAALHALYARADAVWFPSIYEGFGMPVLEAMACSAPVVASAASSIPEIAGLAALLADPHSEDDHLERIVALLEQPELRARYARLGRERAEEFTWQRSAGTLRQCFEEIR